MNQDLPFCFHFRFERLRKFVKAITKLTRSDLARVIVPEVFRLEELNNIFDRYSLLIHFSEL